MCDMSEGASRLARSIWWSDSAAVLPDLVVQECASNSVLVHEAVVRLCPIPVDLFEYTPPDQRMQIRNDSAEIGRHDKASREASIGETSESLSSRLRGA